MSSLRISLSLFLKKMDIRFSFNFPKDLFPLTFWGYFFVDVSRSSRTWASLISIECRFDIITVA
ncbi:Uncharacterised protein [Mycobacterium tuberculosis]|nr:Uncharacterised protein [Mycobacterium tuberculosis]